MKKKIFLAIALLIAGLPLGTFASVPGESMYPVLSPLEKMKPNGEYSVYVKVGNDWEPAGSLAFDMYLRERTIDLARYLDEAFEPKIRLVQKGGEAAHIDAVFLGGLPPAQCICSDPEAASEKPSQPDFDVVDAFGKTFEFRFPANAPNATLSLTARVESKRISKVPWHFPLSNL